MGLKMFFGHKAAVLSAVFALLREEWEALQNTDRAFGCQDVFFFCCYHRILRCCLRFGTAKQLCCAVSVFNHPR